MTLLFSALFLFPLVTALVAGDIVAAEDHNRTLKTILTRSTSRSSIFAAKVVATFAYVLAAMRGDGRRRHDRGRPGQRL